MSGILLGPGTVKLPCTAHFHILFHPISGSHGMLGVLGRGW